MCLDDCLCVIVLETATQRCVSKCGTVNVEVSRLHGTRLPGLDYNGTSAVRIEASLGECVYAPV